MHFQQINKAQKTHLISMVIDKYRVPEWAGTRFGHFHAMSEDECPWEGLFVLHPYLQPFGLPALFPLVFFPPDG